jgi:CRISPR-associated protein Csb2
LRKAIRAEWRRWRPNQSSEIDVVPVKTNTDQDPAWAGRPRPIEFRRGRSRAGDDGYGRAFGAYRLTFSAPIAGPLCLGYACHYGLGLYLPVRAVEVSER